MTTPQIEKIVNDLLAYSDLDFTKMGVPEIPGLVIKTMEIVEQIKGLTGQEKKDLVIKVVERVVDESDISGSLEPLILPMIPTMIDELVMVSDGKMKINERLTGHTQAFFYTVKAIFASCKDCKGCKGGCSGCKCKKCKGCK